MDHEPGALEGHRPAALRAAQEAHRPARGRSGARGRGPDWRCVRHSRVPGAEPDAAQRPDGPYSRGTAGDRGRVLLRLDLPRGFQAPGPAPRHRKDADSFRLAEAQAGTGRSAQAMTDILKPAASLQERLARRIAAETGVEPVLPATPQWSEPEWEEVAPGISCKLLATDAEKHRVSMLVRLAPGAAYPAHTHAGVEELHLLDGELWIDERKLFPGDYNQAEASTGDQRVWSETGCTCVLITSTQDILR